MILITVLLLAVMLAALLGAYFFVTQVDLSTTRSTMSGTRGYYAAEGGLNLRAETIREIFVGYNRPAGTSPNDPVGALPCQGADLGSGDFQCVTYALQNRDVLTYVVEDAGNPEAIVVPPGEAFQNLNAQQYGYAIESASLGPGGRTEALLRMEVQSRLVPMFQFAAFYGKDLEILPGPAMNLQGPVHANGDLYLDSGASLDIMGQVTTAGDLYRGRKNDSSCNGNPVRVADPANQTDLPACLSGRRQMSYADVAPWNGMIRMGTDVLTVPPPEVMDPVPGEIYYDKADIRIMLDLNGATPEVQVRDANDNVDAPLTAALDACGVVGHADTFHNNREAKDIDMLDVDVTGLMNCIQTADLLGAGKTLADTTEGGLVWYLGVDGPDANAAANNYGIRLANGAELGSTITGAPDIRGLTVVTNQAAYVQGDYNALNKKPAAVMSDSLNILSNGWSDSGSTQSLDNRVASETTINAAFLSGTDTTGGIEGASGQDLGAYNGGLENYPRFHEKWTGRALNYMGSFVSLNQPLRVDGAWVYGAPQYTAPIRNWGYDTDFNDAANLPPLSPRFVYLKQQLFVREFAL